MEQVWTQVLSSCIVVENNHSEYSDVKKCYKYKDIKKYPPLVLPFVTPLTTSNRIGIENVPHSDCEWWDDILVCS